MIIQVVKEYLNSKSVSLGMKGTATISFSRFAYVYIIKTLTGQYINAYNEVEVMDTNDRYLERIFTTDNFYALENRDLKRLFYKTALGHRMARGLIIYGLERNLDS